MNKRKGIFWLVKCLPCWEEEENCKLEILCVGSAWREEMCLRPTFCRHYIFQKTHPSSFLSWYPESTHWVSWDFFYFRKEPVVFSPCKALQGASFTRFGLALVLHLAPSGMVLYFECHEGQSHFMRSPLVLLLRLGLTVHCQHLTLFWLEKNQDGLDRTRQEEGTLLHCVWVEGIR